MQFVVNFPLFTIVLSLFSGALCFMLPGKAARRYTMCYEAFLTVLCLWILQYTYLNGAFTYVMGEFPAPWGNEIRAGVLEATTALIFMIIMLTAVFCGYRFIEKDLDLSKENLYYALLNLMTAALLSMIWTNDLFTGYVFLEILTLTSCGLLIVREIGRTTLAAIRYMILNLLGSGLFLLGVVLLYDLSGHLLMVPIQKVIRELAADPNTLPVLTISTAILTIGLSIKSGLFPFHFWMPDTYGWATPTSAAIMSSLVSKAYIFLLIKIYWRVIGIDIVERMPIRNILLVLGIAGMVIGSVQALHADNINRMAAFSSAANIGYIFMGIGIGGVAGYTAAIFHIFAHAVTKAMLFLTTPRLAEVSGDSLLFKELQGSGLRDRDAGVFFTISAFSMIGIPIFAGFAAKLQFGLAAVEDGAGWRLILVFLALAVSSMLNALYFVRTIIRIYSRPNESTRMEVRPHHRAGYNVPMLVLTVMNLFLGLFSWVTVDLIHRGLMMFS
ncbi:MAG: sodium:proton antiporter [Oscillospiraceae bacterium]|nr:sodium:proton antiporter [Oscillospiraceae bacterium]